VPSRLEPARPLSRLVAGEAGPGLHSFHGLVEAETCRKMLRGWPLFLCHRCTLNSVSSTPTEVAREGMEAWRRGDFETIERMLDPNVEWRWFEPGDWDCHNREDVMQVLRQRFEQGFAKGDMTFAAPARPL
jgi:hypothetical protein